MKEFSILKIYLGVVSIITFIGTLVSFGGLGYQVILHAIITDEESIAQNDYKITQCSENKTVTDKGLSTTTTLTGSELEKCKADAKKSILTERSYQYKSSLVEGISWGVVFLLAFGVHFPILLRHSIQQPIEPQEKK